MDSRKIEDYTWISDSKQIPDDLLVEQATKEIIVKFPLNFTEQPCPYCFAPLRPVYGGDSISYSYCPKCAPCPLDTDKRG